MSVSPGDIFADAEIKMNEIASGDKKYSQAGDLFKKAGNEYKRVKNWLRAGDSFRRAADCMLHISSILEAANNAAEAGRNYSKTPSSFEKAIESFNLASHQYEESGKNVESAKLNQEAGKLIELKHPESALNFHVKASTIFKQLGHGTEALREDKAIGDIYVKVSNFQDASHHYLNLGIEYAQNGDFKNAADFILHGFLSAMSIPEEALALKIRDDVSKSILNWDSFPESNIIETILIEIRAKHYDRLIQITEDYSKTHICDRSLKLLFSSLLSVHRSRSIQQQ